MVHGWPSWDGLKPVVLFLIFPALLGLGVAISGPWPKPVLYGLAALMGLWVFLSAFRGTELIIACFILYLPFSTTYVIPIAPGINGTNMLIALGMFATALAVLGDRKVVTLWPSGTTAVLLFAILTCLSALTIMREPDGYSYLMHSEIMTYKGWVEQFIFYFIALSCIRSIEQAKRLIIYMCIGAIVLVLYSVPEMLSKMGNSTIEKSRIGGPHQQSNQFGGFVAYSLMPLIAFFVVYIKDVKAWLLAPYFLIAAKVLISTFSRGAYLAMAAGAFLAGYYKGKGFLFMWMTIALCGVLLFPSLIPESIMARFEQTTVQTTATTAPAQLDASSETRIVMWRAAAKMTAENPILGKGFMGFQKLKSEYTEVDVEESDPHSMYFYISSQMGIPALILFLIILGLSFHMGRLLSRNRDDLFLRAIGVGGASLTVCYAVICVFGSRAVDLEFSAYFWVYFACMQVICLQLKEAKDADEAKHKKENPTRTNAFEARDKFLASNADSAEPVVSPTNKIEPKLLGSRNSDKPSKQYAATWRPRSQRTRTKQRNK
jgi:O-antigen ligase